MTATILVACKDGRAVAIETGSTEHCKTGYSIGLDDSHRLVFARVVVFHVLKVCYMRQYTTLELEQREHYREFSYSS